MKLMKQVIKFGVVACAAFLPAAVMAGTGGAELSSVVNLLSDWTHDALSRVSDVSFVFTSIGL